MPKSPTIRRLPGVFWQAVPLLAVSVITISCGRAVREQVNATIQPSATARLDLTGLPEIVEPDDPPLATAPVQVVTATPRGSAEMGFSTPSSLLQLLPTTPDSRWQACSNSPLSRLHVGDRAFVSYDPYLPNRVRTRPVLHGGAVLGQINPGESVEILEGPICNDEVVWWQVKSMVKDLQGWTVEGDQNGYWLIPTSAEGPAWVPPSNEPECPVDNESFCAFIREMARAVVRGDMDDILAHTHLAECSMDDDHFPQLDHSEGSSDQECAFWGIFGTGLSGLSSTPVLLFSPSWSRYATPPRKVSALLIPPLPDLTTTGLEIPQSPAIFIKTADATWDWVFFVDRINETWGITALLMVSKDSQEYEILSESALPWP